MDLIRHSTYCINLKSRPDRYRHAQKQFEALGLTPIVQYHQPDKDPRGGNIGCWQSHLDCIKKADKGGHLYAWNNEDDPEFIAGLSKSRFRKIFGNIRRFIMKMPKNDWDILYLGCIPVRTWDAPAITWGEGPETGEIVRTQALTTTSYIVNLRSKNIRRFLTTDTLSPILRLDPSEQGRAHIDVFYFNYLRAYCIKPVICLQNTQLSSDNIWTSFMQLFPSSSQMALIRLFEIDHLNVLGRVVSNYCQSVFAKCQDHYRFKLIEK